MILFNDISCKTSLLLYLYYWFSWLWMCDFPYSNWICVASFSLDDLIIKNVILCAFWHTWCMHTLFTSRYGLCVFFTFRFLFWFFGSKSRESLVLSFWGKRMMYGYQSFCLSNILRMRDAFFDCIFLLVRYFYILIPGFSKYSLCL